MSKKILIFTIALIGFLVDFRPQTDKPTLYIIGDSTVKNGSGKGSDSLWGWGSVIAPHFDTTRIDIQNHAIGGRSSRTFLTDGRWDKILKTLKTGDFVIMQFGHNDAGALDDTSRARGSIRGISDSSKAIYWQKVARAKIIKTYPPFWGPFFKSAREKPEIVHFRYV